MICETGQERERERGRQRGRATDIIPAGVPRVKSSIPVKTHLAASVPLFAIKPYSTVLVAALMVFHYIVPKDTASVVSFNCIMMQSCATRI